MPSSVLVIISALTVSLIRFIFVDMGFLMHSWLLLQKKINSTLISNLALHYFRVKVSILI